MRANTTYEVCGESVKLGLCDKRLLKSGMGLHSSTSQLNLNHFRHKAHPEHPLLPPNI